MRVQGTTAEFTFETYGHLALFAEGDLEAPGASAGATAILRMPTEGPHAGEWFCAGQGTSVTMGDPQKTFTLGSLVRLGACPGTPVAGEIDGCFGGDLLFCPKGTKLTSSLDGAPFDWTSAVKGWGGAPGYYQIFLDNGGLLVLDIELDTVLGGYLFIAPGSPDAGAVYCFGGGSLQPGGQGAIKFTLTGLSRLGTCADATPVGGELSGCSE